MTASRKDGRAPTRPSFSSHPPAGSGVCLSPETIVDLAPPRSGQRAAYKEVLHAVGYRSFPCTGAVKGAIQGLTKLLRQDEAFRHRPERPVDFLFEAFAERVRTRGHGLSRRADDGRICWHSSSEDAGCKLTDLDGVSINRLLAIDALATTAGPTVTPKELPLIKPGRTPPNPAARGLIERAIGRSAGKLPADPLDSTKVDIGEPELPASRRRVSSTRPAMLLCLVTPSRTACSYRNEQALLRLVSAVLVEIDETWACDNKAYIKWECRNG